VALHPPRNQSLQDSRDDPVRQIAEALNLPEGTVKTRLRAARQALHYQLGDNLGEEGNR
jgi:DNA-directed RNA polymerase specialized sigma24 family protein